MQTNVVQKDKVIKFKVRGNRIIKVQQGGVNKLVSKGIITVLSKEFFV